MKKIQLISIFLILTLISSKLIAQNNTGFALLKIDVDARAAAMSGAYSALTKDASASYWNPAGLALAENPTITVMHNDWLWDFSHSFAAVQFIKGDHNLALSFNYLQVSDIEIRGSVPTIEPSGKTEAFNLAIGLSYAFTYTEDWYIGLSLKYLFEKYYLVSAPGWAIDMGLIKKNLLENMDFGLTIQNIGKMSKLEKEATPLPLLLRAGFAYKISQFFDDKLTVAPELRWIKDEQSYLHFGADYKIVEYLSLRAGLHTGNDGMLWTAGVGINYDTLHLDYAYAPFENELGSSNRISVGFSF